MYVGNMILKNKKWENSAERWWLLVMVQQLISVHQCVFAKGVWQSLGESNLLIN